MEDLQGHPPRKKNTGLKILMFFLILLVVITSLFAINYSTVGGVSGSVIKAYSAVTTELVCKNQEYQRTEIYMETVPYQDAEYYTEVVSGKSCDSSPDCYCLHYSWAGLGACDSCQCTKSRTVTKYREEQKSRPITQYQEVCIKVKKWEEPNYNEDWLNYPELYNRNGERIK